MNVRDTIIAGCVAFGASAVSAVTTWLVHRRPVQVTAHAAEVDADASWQTAMNDGFAKLSTQYETRNKELVDEVGQLRSEVRGLAQHVESLETILRANGLPIPRRPVPVNMGGLTVMRGDKK